MSSTSPTSTFDLHKARSFVRTEAPPKLPATWRALRAALRAASWASPELGAQLAQAAFRTPPRARTSPADEDALLLARRLEVRLDRAPLATWAFGAGPTVLLVHGWGGRGVQLRAFIAPLVARGHRVVLFDAPAHGATPGKRSSAPELARAVGAVLESVGPVHAIVAHSMGAASSVLATQGAPTTPLVMLAPARDARLFTGRFAWAMGFDDAQRARFEAALERNVGHALSSLDVAQHPRDVPVLVVHDELDKEIPIEEGARIAATWPRATLVRTRGLGHVRLLRDPEVVARAVAFVEGIAR